MGISGSDVAKDASDVIFMDDNFSNIVLGISEGRRLFDNLKKSTAYTLTHLFPEALPILLELTFGLPLALNALLILSIDVGTEMMPAISYAREESEIGLMDRKYY
jgi:sodium/potassium-transporting ATPase subunit alpha